MSQWRASWPALRMTAALSVAAAVAITTPWWGRRALAGMAFFRVRTVEVDGARYLSAGDVVSRLRVDTTASVWDDQRPLEARVRGMVQVRSVAIGRKLPGTLVVRVTERLPVALAPAPGGGGGGGTLRAYDGAGTILPIDPTRVDVDLPIVTGSDLPTLRLLDEVREALPALFARISDVRRTAAGDLLFSLGDTRVRAPADIDVARLAEILPVAADLARRHAGPAELDLRYRDQVVARLP